MQIIKYLREKMIGIDAYSFLCFKQKFITIIGLSGEKRATYFRFA